MIKHQDKYAIPESELIVTDAKPLSVTTNETMEEIANAKSGRRIWQSNRNEENKPATLKRSKKSAKAFKQTIAPTKKKSSKKR